MIVLCLSLSQSRVFVPDGTTHNFITFYIYIFVNTDNIMRERETKHWLIMFLVKRLIWQAQPSPPTAKIYHPPTKEGK